MVSCPLYNTVATQKRLNALGPQSFFGFSPQCWETNSVYIIKVKNVQRSGAEAIRTQIHPSKPKQEITKITNSQNTKRTYGQMSEQLFPKRLPLSNLSRYKNKINTHKVKCHRNADTKAGKREPQQNYRIGMVSNALLGA